MIKNHLQNGQTYKKGNLPQKLNPNQDHISLLSSNTTLNVAPPSCIDIEETVLACFINNFDNYAKYMFHLNSDIFYDEKNRLIFDAIQELKSNGKTVDMLTVTHQLKKSTVLEKVGGPHQIAVLCGKSIQIDDVHIRTLLEYHLRRKLAAICSDKLLKSYELGDDIFDQIDELQSLLSELNAAKHDEFVIKSGRTADNLETLMFGTEEEKKEISGIFKHKIPIGWKKFDEKIGITDNKIIVIGAPTKHGKSKFTQSIVFNILDKTQNNPKFEDMNISVCWYSAEETNIDLGFTYLSNKVFIKPKTLKEGKVEKLTPDQRKKYKEGLEMYKKHDIDVISGAVYIDQLSAYFKNFTKARPDNFNILIIDNFLSLRDIGEGAGRKLDVEDAVIQKILTLKQDTKALIFLVHHFKKDDRNDKEIAESAGELEFTHMKGSEGFARIANAVLIVNQINIHGAKVEQCYSEEYKEILERLFIVKIAANRDDNNTGDKYIRFFANLDYDHFIEFDNLLN